MKKIIIVILFTVAFGAGFAAYLAARGGCCSRHGGVCGCGGTYLLCCDGTLSPSCKCE